MKIVGLTEQASEKYIALLSKIESGDNPKAKAQTSSASGRFQPIKATWESYGYPWSKVFDDKLQYEFAERFTNDNARALIKAGCAVNFATLYASHFLGLGGALKVMRGQPSASINTVTSAAQRKANPSILSTTIKINGGERPRTVQDFCDWLERKTGDSVYKTYTAEAAQPKPVETKPVENKTIVLEPVAEQSKGKLGLIGFIIGVVVIAAVVAFTMLKGA